MRDKIKNKKYNVWLSQVNATIVEVTAKNKEEARDKAHRKWRREMARTYITSIEEHNESTN